MKNIYQKIYSDQKNLGDLAKSPRVRIMLDIINKLNLQGKNILDVGCYNGTFLSLIKNRNNNFFGLEVSDWGVEQSRKREMKIEQYFFDDKTKFPYENNYFDVIVAGEIIEHIYDTDFFLTETYRILKSEGKLLLSTPNVASLGRRLLLLFGINPIIELSPNEPASSGHIRYFTFRTLRKLLEKHNFRTIFCGSDCVNFSKNGRIKFSLLANIFPSLGTSLIYLAKKQK